MLHVVKVGEKLIEKHRAGKLETEGQLLQALGNKWFRLNRLYYIKDKDGSKVRFRANKAQRKRFINSHCRDLILKARQLGFTTFEMLDALDDCLFNDDFAAGCICHKLDDAKDIFDNKIRFAYENIDDAWLAIFSHIGLKWPKPSNDKSMGYKFSNGSSIGVSTSYRGGTLQRLHVSEFGKICRQYPAKAREIVTGAFEAVGMGNKITLESTAEGREGYFYDYSTTAQQLQEQEKALTELDFQFHFFPWWEEPTYQMESVGVVIPQHMAEYFDELEAKFGIETTREQRNWYAKKAESLKDDMQREYPSHPDEAFSQAVGGAYYAKQMRSVRKQGRLTDRVHYNEALPVITGWDLGMDDSMVIWFAQVVGREVHLIDYYENSGEGLAHYAKVLGEKGYVYGGHFGPHDLAVRELGEGLSRLEKAREYGIRFEVIPRINNQQEGIEAVRSFLPNCWFNEQDCAQGVNCLDNYRKEWDENLGRWKDKPRHDWASHGAKAFETLARAPLFSLSSAALPSTSTSTSKHKSWGAFT